MHKTGVDFNIKVERQEFRYKKKFNQAKKVS